eukprot:g48633.t1
MKAVLLLSVLFVTGWAEEQEGVSEHLLTWESIRTPEVEGRRLMQKKKNKKKIDPNLPAKPVVLPTLPRPPPLTKHAEPVMSQMPTLMRKALYNMTTKGKAPNNCWDVDCLPEAPQIFISNAFNKRIRSSGRPPDCSSIPDKPIPRETVLEEWHEKARCFRKVWFAGIGSKCGSTSLWTQISRHPQFIPSKKKEICIRKNYKNNLTAFWENFPPQRDCRYTPNLPFAFDACPNDYMFYDPTFKSCLTPDAYLIMLVRDPLARMMSGYYYWKPRGMLDFNYTLDEFILKRITEQSQRVASNYIETLLTHLEFFPPERILIAHMVDVTRAECEEAMRNITDFLQIEPLRSPCKKFWQNKSPYTEGVPSMYVQDEVRRVFENAWNDFFHLVGVKFSQWGQRMYNTSEFLSNGTGIIYKIKDDIVKKNMEDVVKKRLKQKKQEREDGAEKRRPEAAGQPEQIHQRDEEQRAAVAERLGFDETEMKDWDRNASVQVPYLRKKKRFVKRERKVNDHIVTTPSISLSEMMQLHTRTNPLIHKSNGLGAFCQWTTHFTTSAPCS